MTEPNNSIVRPPYENGFRWATCERCGMSWCEHERSTELFGEGTGTWTAKGEREHECPEPLPYRTAKQMADMAAAACGVVLSQKLKARIRLGLASDPREAGA